jgi:HD-GYP domain-containing protein (c-di-GMP phosphodiesterase class II)
MVKIAHSGQPLEADRIKRMGEKKVVTLYVLKEDYSTVVASLVRGALTAGANQSVANSLRLEQYFKVAESVMVELVRLPLTAASLSRAVSVTHEIANTLSTNADFSTAFRIIFSLGEAQARHAMGTVVISNWIANKVGWTSPKVLAPICMGAFLHDIGLKEVPKEIYEKDRLEMTPEEFAIYQAHPTRGVQILSTLDSIPIEVLRIVQEHHEIPNGNGFPSHLRGDRMFPLAKVVSFANVLTQELFDKVIDGKPFLVDEFLARVDMVYKPMYGTELTKAVKAIFTKK